MSERSAMVAAMRATYDDMARRQLGLVTTAQLSAREWSRAAIRNAVRRGDLIPVPHRRGVLRCRGVAVTLEQVRLAAQLAAGDGHVLSALTATDIWGMRNYPSPVGIDLVAESSVRTRLVGVVGHRTLWLPASHRTRVGALPVTTYVRTLVDTCGQVPAATLRAAFHDGLRRNTMTPMSLARCLDAVPRSGRRASRPIRELAATVIPGYDPGESEPEFDLDATIVRAGYPPPTKQVWVRGPGWRYRIDVAYPELRHGFEYQSEQEHRTLRAFHGDPLRTVRLQRAGWTIWPITSQTGRAEVLLILTTIFDEASADRTA